jgi:hypothetical protein
MRFSTYFHQTIQPGHLIHGLKPFLFLLRIRRDMIDLDRKNRACGVNAPQEILKRTWQSAIFKKYSVKTTFKLKINIIRNP